MEEQESRLLEQGRRALETGAWEEARRAFAAALEGDASSPEALEGLGWALFWLDEPERSLEIREDAYRRWRERGDDRSAARVAIYLGLDYADFRGAAVAAGWLQRARRLLEPYEEGAEHGWLALWEGHIARALEHDCERALALATRAAEIGRRLGQQDLELLALALEGLVRVTEGDVEAGMRQLDEATAAAVAGEFTDIDSVAATCCFLMHACERVRDYERAAAWSERIEAFARRWKIGSVLVLCETEAASVKIGRGEWDEAERLLHRSKEILEQKRPLLAPEALMHLGELRRRQGRTEEAEALFQRTEPRTLSILGLAAIALDRGDAEASAFYLERLRGRSLAEKWIERAVGLEMLVRARLALGQTRAAQESCAELEGVASRVGTPAIRAIRASARGMILTRSGDLAEARRSFEDALDAFERCGAPWEAGRTRLDLADVLFHAAHLRFAREETIAAAAAFRALGASADLQRAEAMLRRIESAPSAVSPPAGPRLSILTRREVEVLRMVATGMSDKEVAVTLHLSEHTVHRHVSNILGKLSQPSRAAAVAEATRGGLI